MKDNKDLKYSCNPREFIGSHYKELYKLEEEMQAAIKAVAEYRQGEFGENLWKQAVPQTLVAILNGFDNNASKVAAKAYLSGETETL